ncbi:MAG TPA: exo-alpha-sialidase [Thermoanaerobaculia bacterium]|nr:exo-alpha-sialidase [Thermoanaerobaculia bacterium]
MRKISLPLLMLLVLTSISFGSAQAVPPGGWPSVSQQLANGHVNNGSALEALIRRNQDFSLLRDDEAFDSIRVPLWLRVAWRKAHPEGKYEATDPTGGYPFVLKEVYEWMTTHQDFQIGVATGNSEADDDFESAFEAATVGTNVRLSGSATNPRSESDIRVNPFDPTKIIAASNNIGGTGQQAQFRSTDGGATWSTSFLPLQTGDAFHSDPTVDWTSNGTAWSTTLGINSSGTQLKLQAYKSVDNGATWTFDGTVSGTQTNTDKQMMWIDHNATSAFKDNIYLCWHNGAPQFVNRRTSTGWGTPIQISGTETTGTAIGCDVKTNGSGDVFVFWPATGNRRMLVSKSTNGGVSFGTPVIITTTFDSFDIGIPSFNSRRLLIYVTGGAYRNGTVNDVYATWADLTGATGCTSATNEPGSNAASTCKVRIKFSRSTDGGATWSSPIMINNQAGLNDQFNQAMVIDEATGRIAITYYDTVADSTRKKVHVYYQTSNDRGVTWSTPLQVTTAQTDETISGSDSGNQFGDYNSLHGLNGVYFPSFTDRRSGGKEEIWSASINESGVVCTPPAAPTGLTVTGGANQTSLSWGAVSGATSYRVYRATTSGGPYTLVGSPTGTSFTDTGLACNTPYFYVVTAFSSCESGNSLQASATTSACPACTVTTRYSNGFETGTTLSDWTTGTFVSGGVTTDWRGIQTCTARTGSKIFRFGGNNCTSDYGSNRFAFAQPGGAAGIAIPAGSSTTRLSFWHRRAFEANFDGGLVAVSINGSNYFFVPATAILSGATYNGTAGGTCQPTGAAGVSLFTGSQTTFVNTVVDLDAVCNAATGLTTGCAGQSVRIAFTAVSDCSVTGDGWFLDDVTVTACTP